MEARSLDLGELEPVPHIILETLALTDTGSARIMRTTFVGNLTFIIKIF
jgi:hypothetical protein